MNTFLEWAAAHPVAAADLMAMYARAPWNNDAPTANGKSEAWAQQQVRFLAARQGAWAMRNNVGAVKATEHTTCPFCSRDYVIQRDPVRYGLANDSPQLNDIVKSSALILCIPRLITKEMVGRVIGQFGAIEVKHPGWVPGEDKKREGAQAAFGARVESLGGFFRFSTGGLEL